MQENITLMQLVINFWVTAKRQLYFTSALVFIVFLLDKFFFVELNFDFIETSDIFSLFFLVFSVYIIFIGFFMNQRMSSSEFFASLWEIVDKKGKEMVKEKDKAFDIFVPFMISHLFFIIILYFVLLVAFLFNFEYMNLLILFSFVVIPLLLYDISRKFYTSSSQLIFLKSKIREKL